MDSIRVFSLDVYGVENGGMVCVGPNLVVGGSSNSKTNVANCTVNGDCARAHALLGFVNDPDLIDTPAFRFPAVGPW